MKKGGGELNTQDTLLNMDKITYFLREKFGFQETTQMENLRNKAVMLFKLGSGNPALLFDEYSELAMKQSNNNKSLGALLQILIYIQGGVQHSRLTSLINFARKHAGDYLSQVNEFIRLCGIKEDITGTTSELVSSALSTSN